MANYHIEQKLNKTISIFANDVEGLYTRVINAESKVELLEQNHKRTQMKLGILSLLVLLSLIL